MTRLEIVRLNVSRSSATETEPAPKAAFKAVSIARATPLAALSMRVTLVKVGVIARVTPLIVIRNDRLAASARHWAALIDPR